MINNNIWNSAAKWGLVVGLCMSCSRIFEQRLIISGELGDFAFMAVEWVAAAILFVVLLYNAIYRSAEQLAIDGTYSVRSGFNYAILISIMAAILVAISSYIYVDLAVGGYNEYIAQSVSSLRGAIALSSMSEEMAASYEGYLSDMLAASKEDAPSIFAALLSQISTYIFTGGIVGLIASWAVSHKVKQPQEVNDVK